MSSEFPNVPELLELGILATAVLFVVGLLYLVLGRIFGGAKRGARKGAGPPAPGGVPNERHQNTGAVSVR